MFVEKTDTFQFMASCQLTAHVQFSNPIHIYKCLTGFTLAAQSCTIQHSALTNSTEQSRAVQNCTLNLKKIVVRQCASQFHFLRTNMENVKIADHAFNISQFPLQPSVYKRMLPFDVPTAADHVCVCLRWRSTVQIAVYTRCAVPCRALTDSDKTAPRSQWEPSFWFANHTSYTNGLVCKFVSVLKILS